MVKHAAATDATGVGGDALGPLLVEQEVLGEAELERAEARAGEYGLPLEEILREERLVPHALLERAVAEHYRVPTVIQTSVEDAMAEQEMSRGWNILVALFGEETMDRCVTGWQEWKARRRRQALERRALLEARRAEPGRL